MSILNTGSLVKQARSEGRAESKDELTRLRSEVRRLTRALRLCYDDARAAVGDTDTINDRACGMCRLARHVRDTARGALRGKPAPRRIAR